MSWTDPPVAMVTYGVGRLAHKDPNQLMMLIPALAIFLLFQFMFGGQQRKEKRRQDDLLKSMKKNDRVVTIGGIYGVVVNVQKDSEDVTLRIDESTNTRMRVLRSAISRIIADDGEANQE